MRGPVATGYVRRPMILVVSLPDDEHGSAVVRQLQALGVPCDRLAARSLWQGFVYSVDPLDPRFGHDAVFTTRRVFPDGRNDPPQPVTAVYWRRPVERDDHLKLAFPSAGDVAEAEAWHAFRLAAEALPRNLFPLGHPSDLERSANKLLQLNLARRHGFAVPETLVANDPDALATFLRRQQRVVVKPLHAAAAYTGADRSRVERLLWCRGFDAGALAARLQPGQRTQLLVQQAVDKRCDWRLTVLPHTTVACEIDTSSLAPDEPDWRKRTKSLPHRLVDLDADFERRLRAFLAALDLPAGYFDFAVARDGTPFFLEMNTNAQWLWIERMTGHPISAEIATALARGTPQPPA